MKTDVTPDYMSLSSHVITSAHSLTVTGSAFASTEPIRVLHLQGQGSQIQRRTPDHTEPAGCLDYKIPRLETINKWLGEQEKASLKMRIKRMPKSEKGEKGSWQDWIP